MNEQPEALRLADWLDGSSNGPLDARHQAAAELRRLHEVVERKSDAIQKLWKQRDTLEAANKEFEKRQEWWNDRMFEMEAALRQAVGALEKVYGKGARCEAAITITAAKQALGEQT